MLGYNHRIKGRIAVTGDFQGHFTKVGLERFTTEAITAVATVFARRIMLGITEMLIDLSLSKGLQLLVCKAVERSLQILSES